jgi:hypothetical protein
VCLEWLDDGCQVRELCGHNDCATIESSDSRLYIARSKRWTVWIWVVERAVTIVSVDWFMVNLGRGYVRR